MVAETSLLFAVVRGLVCWLMRLLYRSQSRSQSRNARFQVRTSSPIMSPGTGQQEVQGWSVSSTELRVMPITFSITSSDTLLASLRMSAKILWSALQHTGFHCLQHACTVRTRPVSIRTLLLASGSELACPARRQQCTCRPLHGAR